MRQKLGTRNSNVWSFTWVMILGVTWITWVMWFKWVQIFLGTTFNNWWINKIKLLWRIKIKWNAAFIWKFGKSLSKRKDMNMKTKLKYYEKHFLLPCTTLSNYLLTPMNYFKFRFSQFLHPSVPNIYYHPSWKSSYVKIVINNKKKMSTWQKLGTCVSLFVSVTVSVKLTVTVSVTCLCWSLAHAEQLLFSSLCSEVTVYSRKLQCVFLDHHVHHPRV